MMRTTLAVVALYGVLLQGLFGSLRPLDLGPAEIALHAVLCSNAGGTDSRDGRTPSSADPSCCVVLCGAGPAPLAPPADFALTPHRDVTRLPVRPARSAVAVPVFRPNAFEARGPPAA